MKKITTLIISAVFIANISPAQSTADKIILQKGNKLLTTTTANGSMTMEMMGQNMETITQSTGSSTLDVKSVTSTGYIITTKINKLKIKTKGGMAPDTEFDSEKKGDMDTDIGKNLKDKFQPKDIEITFAGTPVVSSTKNDAEDMDKIMQSVMSGTGADGMDVFMLIPAGKKAGDVWTDSTNVNGVRVINTYSLKDIRGKEAVVSVNTLSNINKKMQAQGAELIINMDSKTLSDNTIDITTGLIKERRTTVEGKGKLSAAGQEMPMTTKVTSVTTVKNM